MGNTNIVSNYNVKLPINYQFNYFRLLQTDFDKKESYSDIVFNQCLPEQSITISPNPSNGIINIKGVDENTAFEVYNLLGTKVDFGYLNKEKIDLSLLDNGVYLIKFNLHNELLFKKVSLFK